ncbi:VanZ family protein [Exiguobacterium sp. MH3]|uniref:VanZ family protein n=1 Tax=Exiguobacterium sp. MH3 TaxID=1399115 RepID=UPI0003C3CB34|nr:VanZ family protein [Exiguobacterium sp. MH3]AHA30772.1 teicoplanin resistance protein VanZ [Exiguobacterium sp. MH3]
MKKITWSGYVVLAVLLVLFISSSMPYQAQSIKPGLSRFIPLGFVDHLRFISFSYHGEVSVDALGRSGFIEFFIRKAAHVSTFLVLGVGLIDLTRRRLTTGLAVLFAYSLAITVAVFDEFHQILTGDRTGLIQDVLLDGTGALIGIGCYLLVYRKKVRRQAGSLSFQHEKNRHHF